MYLLVQSCSFMFQVGKLLYPGQQQIHAFEKCQNFFFFTLEIMAILLSVY